MDQKFFNFVAAELFFRANAKNHDRPSSNERNESVQQAATQAINDAKIFIASLPKVPTNGQP